MLPLLDKRFLFERVRSMWPDAVCHVSEASTCDALNNIYGRIDTQLEGHTDRWLQLAAWAFHQAINELARAKSAAPRAALGRHEVSFEAFDWWMRMNFSDESCAKFFAEYIAARA